MSNHPGDAVATIDDRGAEQIQEFVHSAGERLRVEAARGLLRGVKLLGLVSRNGRRYEERALRQSMGLYEGSKVNVNHPTHDPLAPRDYRDRLGVVRNVRLEPGRGLYGDLHYNPSHPLAEQLAWDAANAPENVGLSHNVLARTRRENGELVVEAITRVQSVDLVADPATTAGLFEARQPDAAEPLPDRVLESISVEVAALRDRIAHTEAALARTERRFRIEELFRERVGGGSPLESVVSDAERQELLEAPEASLPDLVAQHARARRALHESSRPKCREKGWGAPQAESCDDTAAFVAALRRPR